jgi:hypothetical protein
MRRSQVDSRWVRQGTIPGIVHRGEIEEIGPEPYVNMRGKETTAYARVEHAALVAAAPELYIALRDLLDRIRIEAKSPATFYAHIGPVMDQGVRALSKADERKSDG